MNDFDTGESPNESPTPADETPGADDTAPLTPSPAPDPAPSPWAAPPVTPPAPPTTPNWLAPPPPSATPPPFAPTAPTPAFLPPPQPPALDAPKPKRHWIRWTLVTIVALGVVGGLTAWALQERKSAHDWKDASNSWEQRSGRLDAQLAASEKDKEGVEDDLRRANARIQSLASQKAQVTDERRQLTQIIDTVPSVTQGLRDCVAAAFQISSDMADFLAAFPNGSTAALERDSDEARRVCEDASVAAGTLEGIISTIQGG